MIEIKRERDCCGCEACVQVCPKGAISFEPSSEGFFYPKVDINLCVRCELCDMMCPVINPSSKRAPFEVFAAFSDNDEIRLKSSSGGVFTLLAAEVIARGGVVVGARYNSEWQVEHIVAESIEQIELLRTSKYAQSRVGDTMLEVKKLLKSGREVLFVGTPCQVAALRLLLRREYDNLLLVDFLCHGVPSPKVWSRYLEQVAVQNNITIDRVSHRDKSSGWRVYSVALEGHTPSQQSVVLKEKFHQNGYLRGFLNNLYIRPSCHSCPTRGFSSGADITLADFWYYEKWFTSRDDNKGCNMVIPHTPKGRKAFNSIECSKEAAPLKAIQKIAYHSERAHRKRKQFFEEFEQNERSIHEIVHSLTRTPRYKKITRSIRKFLGL